ncbi:hypothetical protein ACIRPX_28830 [Streptomyces sp. NPDC101225]|uniref:hypothetical protein n=1 Tax=Streptomyces sp. NPDC101225 TaxID=3366135 RepID=UPI0038152654
MNAWGPLLVNAALHGARCHRRSSHFLLGGRNAARGPRSARPQGLTKIPQASTASVPSAAVPQGRDRDRSYGIAPRSG